MHSPLRIAVLECDTPIDSINNAYGGYGGVFKELFKQSARALGKPDTLDPENGLEISRWDIVGGDEYPNLDEIDALVMTGSSAFSLHFHDCTVGFYVTNADFPARA